MHTFLQSIGDSIMSFTSLMSLLSIFEEGMFSFVSNLPVNFKELEKNKIRRRLELLLEKLNEI